MKMFLKNQNNAKRFVKFIMFLIIAPHPYEFYNYSIVKFMIGSILII